MAETPTPESRSPNTPAGPGRFYIELGLAVLSAALFVLTAVSPKWIEEIFGVEPDGGNGSLEWLIVGVLFAVTIAFTLAARREWRRIRTS